MAVVVKSSINEYSTHLKHFQLNTSSPNVSYLHRHYAEGQPESSVVKAYIYTDLLVVSPLL